MRIAVASDHAGFHYKLQTKEYLAALGHEAVDFGTDSSEACDYPLFIRPAAGAVANGECERGIVFGGSGNGEAMVSNRLPGIRCAVVWGEESATLARRHNDANMISIGERLVTWELCAKIIELFLSEPFDGGRHERRIKLIDEP